MHNLHQFAVPIGIFILTLVFGFWLSHAGRPYNGLLFNVHKLVALGCIVLLGIQFSKTLHAPNWQLVILLAVSALCVIAFIASGALMSAGKLDYTLMLTVHRIAPVPLALCCALALYFLERQP